MRMHEAWIGLRVITRGRSPERTRNEFSAGLIGEITRVSPGSGTITVRFDTGHVINGIDPAGEDMSPDEVDAYSPFIVDQRLRIAETYPNIRWAGECGRAFGFRESDRAYRIRLEGGHEAWIEQRYLTDAPDEAELLRRERLVTTTTTTAARQARNEAIGLVPPAPSLSKYVQKIGDVLILGDNGKPIGCVDAQVPLGECRVQVMINGQARWYRMVEAVSREAEEEAAKVGVFTPGRRLKL